MTTMITTGSSARQPLGPCHVVHDMFPCPGAPTREPGSLRGEGLGHELVQGRRPENRAAREAGGDDDDDDDNDDNDDDDSRQAGNNVGSNDTKRH